MLIIFDLEGTLVFSTPFPLERPADFQTTPFLGFCTCHTYKRPGVSSCLATLAAEPDLVLAVWSAADPWTVDAIVAEVFGDLPLAFAWSQSNCTRGRLRDGGPEQFASSGWLKKMKRVKRAGFGLEHTVIVDDNPACVPDYGNLVPVRSWQGEPEDDELLRLVPYLLSLRGQNVRTLDKRSWRGWRPPPE
ncbi:MAG: HAD family hydrolase [Candidatus Riflebacteria bacterium]|nr:HAD family hydrolase [Candidatus Riflebacteria bacterium]